ncbi:uncharacterized protein LOC142982383 [Anticarsia gemmatalis]|uniref:uncharacterized protein LOC142982383 n=1 Tax=Anticarsia gemmatalis TaxID=129554 RepID=UPI003F773456
MGARLFLLVTIFVAALVSIRGDTKCNSADWGQLKGTRFILEPVTLTPKIRNFQLETKVPEECDVVNGLFVQACDYDKAPHLKFDGKYLTYIHRLGDLVEAGEFRMSLFCGQLLRGSDFYTALLSK